MEEIFGCGGGHKTFIIEDSVHFFAMYLHEVLYYNSNSKIHSNDFV